MSWLVNKITELITHYGSWGVFWVSIAEEVIAPIPSSLTLMGTGVIFLSRYDTLAGAFLPALLFIAIPAAIGVVVGGVVLYGLVSWGEKVVIDRWGKWLGVSWDHIDRLQKYFQSGHTDEAVLLFLRIVPIFPNSIVSVVCGLVRYPFRSYVVISLLGAIPRALAMALLGWWLGSTYQEYADILSGIEHYIVWGIAAVGLVALTMIWVKKQNKDHAHS